jgi:hypothetical protein
MNDAQIVATYSNTALIGIIQQLSVKGTWWPERLLAAKIELTKRKTPNKTNSHNYEHSTRHPTEAICSTHDGQPPQRRS